MSKVTVIGAGSFGTALAMVLDQSKHKVTVWARNQKQVTAINKTGLNKKYLNSIKIPKSITFTSNLEEALDKSSLVVMVTPSQSVREMAKKIKPLLPKNAPIVSTTKGLEVSTGLRTSQVLREIFGRGHSIHVLSGPSHAEEVASKRPCTVSLASSNKKSAERIAGFFHNEYFRVYHNTDVIGVEIGGAVKNIIAIAAGLCDGLKLGDNAKAALLARGLVEIKRFGIALGARSNTFEGLSGLGDLVTTCFSPYGRNRALGELLGQGKSIPQALKIIDQVVEGVPTTQAVLKMAKKLKIEMPISEEVGKILTKGKNPAHAVATLMKRSAKSEF